MRIIFTLLICVLLSSSLFVQANHGERTFAHSVFITHSIEQDSHVAEKVFVNPFESETEIFTTVSFRLYDVDPSEIEMEIAFDDGDYRNVIIDPHSPKDRDFLVTELVYIDQTFESISFRIKSNRDYIIPYSIYWFKPPVEFSLEQQSFPNFGGETARVCELPTYITRTGWNCPDGQDFSGGTPSLTNVTHLVVHHSAGSNTSSNWAATVLSIWNYHVFTNGWSDIAYNIIVAPDGIIYESRGGNDGYDLDVLSAATCGSNSGSMAVCVLGNYEIVEPTTEALESLEEILAWKAEDRSIDPVGSSSLNSYGVLDHIFGHRQGCATACPGQNLYDELPNVRLSVHDLIDIECIVGTPNLEVTGFGIDDDMIWDSNGDNDGIAEVGEAIELSMTLLNAGNATATDINVVLSTNDNCVTFLDNDLSFGNILAGDDSTNLDFDFTFTATCSPGAIQFFATISSNEGIWVDTIIIDLGVNCIMPIANFEVSPLSGPEPLDVLITNLSQNGQAYNWRFSTGGINIVFGGESPNLPVLLSAGIYTVTLAVNNECGTDSLVKEDYVEVFEVVGLVDHSFINSIYPNPTNSVLNIEFKSILNKAEIFISNAIGQNMLMTQFSGKSAHINVEELAVGQYFINIIEGGGETSFSTSFIKK